MDVTNTHFDEATASSELGHYLQFIAHLDMPLSAKIEMVSALHLIMSNFVDRAFGDDPVQHVNGFHAGGEIGSDVVVGLGKPETDDIRLSSAFASPAAGRRKKEHE
ncbi:hypothetical protein [Aestuariivirga sp.]|uniref:hypothetical protein n=1 Tax=Aestuariivirga sp. TaxID=2650926 RepID=UPI003BA8AEE1